MKYPKVSINILALTDEELGELDHAIQQELYCREVHRRAAQLIQEDLRVSDSAAAERVAEVASQHDVVGRLRREASSSGERGATGDGGGIPTRH